MTFKTRKRLALLVLVVGMPLYVIAAVALGATACDNESGLNTSSPAASAPASLSASPWAFWTGCAMPWAIC